MDIDELIDRFVERINSSPRLSLLDFEVPPDLRLSKTSSIGWDWKVKASDEIDWIEPLEARLRIRFPDSFRSLVTRYQFPELDVGPLMLFSNTSSGLFYELRDRIFCDECLTETLHPNGLIAFALPATGSYDQICFDTRRPTPDRDFPIVRVDHEEILCNEQLVVIEEVAPSFCQFVSTYLAGGYPSE